MVKITVDGVTKEYDKGITYREVAEDYADQYDYDIILAKRGEKLVELNKKINKDCEITFLTTASDSGHKTYVRGVTLLMLKAFYHVVKDEALKNIAEFENNVSNSSFFNIS